MSSGGFNDVAAVYVRAQLPPECVQLWSAETPHLYSLTVALVDESAMTDVDRQLAQNQLDDGDTTGTRPLHNHGASELGDGRLGFSSGVPLEWEGRRLGARTACISGKQLLLNGVAVTLKGVNRHEHDETRGKAIDEESMRRDARLIKRANFNAVRCSHYPNATRWYEPRPPPHHSALIAGPSPY